MTFKTELEKLINKYSLENGSNTPDVVLAQYLSDCLDAYERAVQRRGGRFNPAKELAHVDPRANASTDPQPAGSDNP